MKFRNPFKRKKVEPTAPALTPEEGSARWRKYAEELAAGERGEYKPTQENGLKIRDSEVTGRIGFPGGWEPGPYGPVLKVYWVPTPVEWLDDPEASKDHMPKLNYDIRNRRRAERFNRWKEDNQWN